MSSYLGGYKFEPLDAGLRLSEPPPLEASNLVHDPVTDLATAAPTTEPMPSGTKPPDSEADTAAAPSAGTATPEGGSSGSSSTASSGSAQPAPDVTGVDLSEMRGSAGLVALPGTYLGDMLEYPQEGPLVGTYLGDMLQYPMAETQSGPAAPLGPGENGVWDPGEGSGSWKAELETNWNWFGPGDGPEDRPVETPSTAQSWDAIIAALGQPPTSGPELAAWWDQAFDMLWGVGQPGPAGTPSTPAGPAAPVDQGAPGAQPPGGASLPPGAPADTADLPGQVTTPPTTGGAAAGGGATSGSPIAVPTETDPSGQGTGGAGTTSGGDGGPVGGGVPVGGDPTTQPGDIVSAPVGGGNGSTTNPEPDPEAALPTASDLVYGRQPGGAYLGGVWLDNDDLAAFGLRWNDLPITRTPDGTVTRQNVSISPDGRIRWSGGSRSGQYLGFAEIQNLGIVRGADSKWTFTAPPSVYYPAPTSTAPSFPTAQNWITTNASTVIGDPNTNSNFTLSSVNLYGQATFEAAEAEMFRRFGEPSSTNRWPSAEWTNLSHLRAARDAYDSARKMAGQSAPALVPVDLVRTLFDKYSRMGQRIVGLDAMQQMMTVASAAAATTAQNIVFPKYGLSYMSYGSAETAYLRAMEWGWQYTDSTMQGILEDAAAVSWWTTSPDSWLGGSDTNYTEPVANRNGMVIAGTTAGIGDARKIAPVNEWAADIWHYGDGSVVPQKVLGERMMSGFYDPRNGRAIINKDTGNPIGYDIAQRYAWTRAHMLRYGGNFSWYPPFLGYVSPVEFGGGADISMDAFFAAGSGGPVRVDAAATFENFVKDAAMSFVNAGGITGLVTWGVDAWRDAHPPPEEPAEMGGYPAGWEPPTPWDPYSESVEGVNTWR